MTNEEKQALIERINKHIEWIKKEAFNRYNDHAAVQEEVTIYEIALATLTAQPIELPQRYSCEGYHIDEAYLVADEDGDCFDRDEVIEKLRQQGYEVQE